MAETSFGDVEGKSVLDLGCGCGMLSIAAMLLGSSHNVGIDIDAEALEIFSKNMVQVFDEEGVDEINFDLINADVARLEGLWAGDQSFLRKSLKFDTVVLNPPFGTKDTPGIDMVFLHQAIQVKYYESRTYPKG